MAIIETENLVKKYKELKAVDEVNLRIEEAECFGLLGPNGAGKTTLIRVITAFSAPTKGTVRIKGMIVDNHLGLCYHIFWFLWKI